MSSTLTDRQQQILDFIYATLEKQGVAPSLREIQAHFKLASPFGVKRHVPCCHRSPRPGVEP